MYPFCLFPLVAEAEIEDEVDIHISDVRESEECDEGSQEQEELKRKEKRMRGLGILVRDNMVSPIGITMVFGTGAQQDGLYPGPKIWCYAPVQEPQLKESGN